MAVQASAGEGLGLCDAEVQTDFNSDGEGLFRLAARSKAVLAAQRLSHMSSAQKPGGDHSFVIFPTNPEDMGRVGADADFSVHESFPQHHLNFMAQEDSLSRV